MTLESFDDQTFFADAPADPAKPVYDAKNKSVGVKPGVTQSLQMSTDHVKIGKASARYTATSNLADAGGWSVHGRRYLKPLDLSKAQAIGFWLYGDGKGEAFKLQLHDNARGWYDMVTHVNFTGWRYQQFDFSGPGNLDRSKVQSLLVYYNGIPTHQTVTCYLDDVRAVPAIAGLRNPELTIGTRRLTFPAELSTGDRLVFDGSVCRLHRKGKTELEWIQPQGVPLALGEGRNPVVLSFNSNLLPQFRVAVSLVKHYP